MPTEPNHSLLPADLRCRLPDRAAIEADVARAVAEDVGDGDITAALLPAAEQASARIITRQQAVLAGAAWVDAVFRCLDNHVRVDWLAHDGERVAPGQTLCRLHGPLRALLTGERTALNLLQTLSATATRARTYADAVEGLPVRILDTRKTLPGLRLAQKYAVLCGGCHNHRMGLFDAVLIKENHVLAAGSIAAALDAARRLAAGKPVEIEVETLAELEQALAAGAEHVLLDNFGLAEMRRAVEMNAGRASLEASGGINRERLRAIAETGVNAISIGDLTKSVDAVDLSMRLETPTLS